MSDSEETESSTRDNGSSSTLSKKRKRSIVWDWFKQTTVDGVNYAICKCGKKFKRGKKSGTSTLRGHMEFRCIKRFEAGMDDSFNQDGSRMDLAYMIVLHDYPLSIVDHVGFRKFVSGLRPEFKMVSRNTIRKDIIAIFEAEKKKNYALLGKIDRIALTTDMWTAKPTKRGFMAITAHFIDDSWILQSRILEFVYVPAPHNSETLLKVLIDALFEWNITGKISAITVDNATANNAMMDAVVDSISRSSLMLRGKFIHMRCCCHILNLIVKEGLDVLQDAIDKIRASCLFWSATQSRREKFENAVRQLNLPLRALETDVKTRWNSTYFMLRIALIYKDVFTMLKNEKNYNSLPTIDEWKLASELCEKLKLFYSVTELFSGSSYPTANHYFVKICQIKLSLNQWVENSTDTLRLMASKMLEKYDKYWSECHVLMGIACVLDPRYKMKLVEYYYNLIYGINREVEIQKIKKYCEDLYAEYQLNVASSGTLDSIPLQLDETTFDDDLFGFDQYLSCTVDNESNQSELDRYLEKPILPRDQRKGFDVLGWWKTEGVNFPILRKMAQDVLSIPVSTVASESSFSRSGRLISPQRSRLHPSTLEALMCAQSWLWNDKRASQAITSSPQPPILTRIPTTPRPPTINDEEEDPDELDNTSI